MSSFVDFDVIEFHPSPPPLDSTRLDSTRLDPIRPRSFIFRTLQLSVALGWAGVVATVLNSGSYEDSAGHE
jgi:hypothetical protein